MIATVKITVMTKTDDGDEYDYDDKDYCFDGIVVMTMTIVLMEC